MCLRRSRSWWAAWETTDLYNISVYGPHATVPTAAPCLPPILPGGNSRLVILVAGGDLFKGAEVVVVVVVVVVVLVVVESESVPAVPAACSVRGLLSLEWSSFVTVESTLVLCAGGGPNRAPSSDKVWVEGPACSDQTERNSSLLAALWGTATQSNEGQRHMNRTHSSREFRVERDQRWEKVSSRQHFSGFNFRTKILHRWQKAHHTQPRDSRHRPTSWPLTSSYQLVRHPVPWGEVLLQSS